jgi:hypothetical protein
VTATGQRAEVTDQKRRFRCCGGKICAGRREGMAGRGGG